jgi:hypothetical protein
MLPDDVLLEISYFYVHEDARRIEEWMRLAHVCRRWRSVVLQSPLRLNLQLVCTPLTPTRDILDIWPPLPLIIRDFDHYFDSIGPFMEGNIIAALEHSDRICKIELINAELGYFTNSAAILESFPELTHLELKNVNQDAYEELEPILPDSFLGGSAPRLRSLILDKLSFPALPKLLLSTCHLVNLDLSSIPRSWYIPPEAMATSLSALTSLESLYLHFLYPPPRPALETRRPPPPPLTRSILPSLIKIEFKGASDYLEVILARIDAPRLDSLKIAFFNQIIFDTPQLFQLISRRPTPTVLEEGYIEFCPEAVTVGFPSRTSGYKSYDALSIRIRCTPSEWQLSSLEQVCSLVFASPFRVERPLYFRKSISDTRLGRRCWKRAMARSFTFIFCCEESLHIGDVCSPYRVRPPRTRWDRSFACPGEDFLEGFPAVETPAGWYREIRCRTRARQSSRRSLSLGHGL